jgi:16S rRNA (cytosine1402-N4)-methyltransferase
MAACRMTEVFHQHVPVLLNESIENLVTAVDGIYIDATFGRGSHAQAILNRLNANGRLIAFDKDPDAVAYAKEHFSQDVRFTILHSSFARMTQAIKELTISGHVNGILFDLGVSSPQLDNPERGFSFAREGKLDMRMDTSQGLDAMNWLASVTEKELADILWQYGEEKSSRRIARAIVSARNETPIITTAQLAKIIAQAAPRKKYDDKHPATRSFQAIRMMINKELTEIQQGLAAALELLAPKGRLLVISFHSLEDRIVKQFIRLNEKGQEVPKGLPIKGAHFTSRLISLAKPIKPSLQEVKDNPRARSAILRIAEKQL